MAAGDVVALVVLTLGVVGLQLASRLREGAVSPDEAYLWYGTLRTVAGERPLRDFRSYEPGRYYWCGAWLALGGRSLPVLRTAVHAFYAVGLFSGLLALRLSGAPWPAVALAALLLALWSFDADKLFEHAWLLVGVAAGALVVHDPRPLPVAVAGAVVGTSAFFGVNLALYLGTGLGGLAVVSAGRAAEGEVLPAVAGFTVGLATGLMPLLGLFVAVPGMARAFYERRVRAVLARGTTNLPLPVPWPWRPSPPGMHWAGRSGAKALQCLFVVLPAAAVSGLAWVVLAPWSSVSERPVVAAAALLTATAMHMAFARADLPHLAQSISPLLLGSVALLGGSLLGGAALLAVLAWPTLGVTRCLHLRWGRRRDPAAFTWRELGGSQHWLPTDQSRLLDRLSGVVSERLGPDEPLVAVPTLILLPTVLGRRSGVYDTYCIYPASEPEQQVMLDQLEREGVRLVVVADEPVDGREDLRFPRTHPRVWQLLQTEFDRVGVPGLPDHLHVFERPAATG